MFYRISPAPAIASASQIAALGDSISVAAGLGSYEIRGTGYLAWARAFGGSRWSFAPTPTQLVWGLGGLSSTQLMERYFEGMLGSPAKLNLAMFGMNDALNNVSPSVVVANALQFCQSMAALDKIPVIIGVTPVPLGSHGNQEGVISARVVAINDATRTAVESAGFHWLDISSTISSSPGVADDTFMYAPTNLHPNSRGASELGRELNRHLSALFNFTDDPLANRAWLTPNTDYSNETTPPTGYSIFVQSGGTTGTQSIIDDAEGRWWSVPMIPLNSYSTWMLRNLTPVPASPAGKTVDAVARLRISEGACGGLALALASNTPGGNLSYDLSDPTEVKGIARQSDGTIVLRTPKVTVPAGATLVYPVLIASPSGGSATIQVAEFGVREWP